ncbi:Putative 2-aminoethylphosphonate import ATP-binding protein PhnT [Clostridium sp. C105KSO13]|nr:hypothetical protein [Clostridium sp. C105KSO13]CUX38593.1 Putative 2-aminoethylphosphonate import ATP-binding protein PhnT [Clostridium sp. C105KSO13]
MEYLKSVGFEAYKDAAIKEISGGQQRVSLILSLITRPKILLLDKPFSNLDAKLRAKMRREILGISNHFADEHRNVVCCRPEELVFSEGPIRGIILRNKFLGFYMQCYIQVSDGTEIIVRTGRETLKENGKKFFFRRND